MNREDELKRRIEQLEHPHQVVTIEQLRAERAARKERAARRANRIWPGYDRRDIENQTD